VSLVKRLTVTIKQLHEKTGEVVRGATSAPVLVTDRGTVVAILADPSLVVERKRRRTLLPEYAALLKRRPTRDVLADLDAVRDR
jgi:hypothetical protein